MADKASNEKRTLKDLKMKVLFTTIGHIRVLNTLISKVKRIKHFETT